MKKRYLFVPLLLLLSLVCTPVWGQTDCFTYDGTIINGLTSKGQAATDLTIPATVTEVASYALYDRSNDLASLVIEGDGNPVFDNNVWGGKLPSNLSLINMGSGMMEANIKQLLKTLTTRGELSVVEIEDYTPDGVSWTDMTSIMTSDVKVVLPAAKVNTQTFGNAEVYGRFTIDKELITYCSTATFQDTDHGSNMLFYVPTKLEDGKVYIERVYYVVAGQGVLIHRTGSSSGYADVPRVAIDAAEYTTNMLVGVTTATTIGATDGDKTNFVLSNGAFHPTSGGTLGANKAYLQILTTEWNAIKGSTSRLELCFDDETALSEELRVKSEEFATATGWYSLDGRKLSDEPTQKGIYIHNGKKVVLH